MFAVLEVRGCESYHVHILAQVSSDGYGLKLVTLFAREAGDDADDALRVTAPPQRFQELMPVQLHAGILLLMAVTISHAG